MVGHGKLAVILHADIAASTTLVRLDERLAHERIQDTFRRLSGTIGRYHGRMRELRGDALLADFDRASDAVSAALAFQAVQTGYNAQLTDEIRPTVRVGIAMGEVIIADNTITGAGVVLAQRVEQFAKPGGLCITAAIHEALPRRMPFDLDSLGEQKIKGFDEQVRVYAVSLLPGATLPEPEAQHQTEAEAISRPVKPAIAVLSFANMTGDPEQEYFSDGLTEDLIIGLSRNHDISVISRNSSFIFKGKSARARDVGDELGAQYVLKGSVRKAGQSIRITAQLIDASSESNLWGERFDCAANDIFSVQDEVVGAILHALGAANGILEMSARKRAIETTTQDPTAYDYYLRGRHYFYQHGNHNFDLAEECYQKAISLDEGFSRPYSALAWLHFIRFKLFRTHSFQDIRDKALDLALHAARLDANDFRAHWVLGMVYIHEGKHAQSRAAFEKALRANPNDANLIAFFAEVLIYCGDTEEAVQRCLYGIKLNPNTPDWYFWILASAYYHLGDYVAALEALERMTAIEHAGRLLAATYAQLDRLEQAYAAAEAYMKLVPDFSISNWARTEFYRDPKELQRFVDGQRRAGLPE